MRVRCGRGALWGCQPACRFPWSDEDEGSGELDEVGVAKTGAIKTGARRFRSLGRVGRRSREPEMVVNQLETLCTLTICLG